MSLALIRILFNQPGLSTYSYFHIGKRPVYPEFKEAEQEAYLQKEVKPIIEMLESDSKKKLNLLIYTPILKTLEYRSDLLERLRKLVENKQIELLSGAGYNSLSVLFSKTLFEKEVDTHKALLKKLFGASANGFMNTAMFYSEKTGDRIAEQGFKYAIVPRIPWFIKDGAASVFNSGSGKLKLFVPGVNEEVNHTSDLQVIIDQNTAGDGEVLLSEVKPGKNIPEYKLPELVANDLEGRGIEAIVGNNLQKDFLKRLTDLNPAVAKSGINEIVEEFLWIGSLPHFSALANNQADRYSCYTSLFNMLYDLEIRLR